MEQLGAPACTLTCKVNCAGCSLSILGTLRCPYTSEPAHLSRVDDYLMCIGLSHHSSDDRCRGKEGSGMLDFWLVWCLASGLKTHARSAEGVGRNICGTSVGPIAIESVWAHLLTQKTRLKEHSGETDTVLGHIHICVGGSLRSLRCRFHQKNITKIVR